MKQEVDTGGLPKIQKFMTEKYYRCSLNCKINERL